MYKQILHQDILNILMIKPFCTVFKVSVGENQIGNLKNEEIDFESTYVGKA